MSLTHLKQIKIRHPKFLINIHINFHSGAKSQSLKTHSPLRRTSRCVRPVHRKPANTSRFFQNFIKSKLEKKTTNKQTSTQKTPMHSIVFLVFSPTISCDGLMPTKRRTGQFKTISTNFNNHSFMDYA